MSHTHHNIPHDSPLTIIISDKGIVAHTVEFVTVLNIDSSEYADLVSFDDILHAMPVNDQLSIVRNSIYLDKIRENQWDVEVLSMNILSKLVIIVDNDRMDITFKFDNPLR